MYVLMLFTWTYGQLDHLAGTMAEGLRMVFSAGNGARLDAEALVPVPVPRVPRLARRRQA